MIPQETIDRVRESADIVELVSGYVNLKKRGINFFGLCPFHSEKSSSFSVNSERQIFHCFGCGEGGNAITFLMKIENFTFIEAVEQLAKKSGISLPSSTERESGSRAGLYEITEKAARIFHNNLLKESRGQVARDYIAKRNITEEIVTDFMLGYSLDDWEGIIRVFRSVKDYEKLLEQVGLIIPREGGKGCYDRFRHRLMFPIRNESGRIVGFGGRRLREDEPAKYINSPETILYQKGKILYGLFENREAIRQAGEVIIVEGNTDLLAMCRSGFRNVVAPLGTALTSAQVNVLARYTNKIILLFDSDEAGLRATLRGVETILNRGLEIQVGLLKQGSDPDSYLKEFGAAGMQAVLDARLPLVEFWATRYRDESKSGVVSDKARFVKSLIQVMAKVDDAIYRSMLIKEIAEKFAMSETAFHQELHAAVRPVSARPASEEKGIKYDKELHSPEWDIIRKMLTRTELQEFILKYCPVEYFADADARIIVENINRLHNSGKPVNAAELINLLTDPKQQNVVARIEMEPYLVSKQLTDLQRDDVWEQACRDIIGFKIRKMEEELKAINRTMLEMERRGESTMKIMREQIKTSREINRLKKEGLEELKNS